MGTDDNVLLCINSTTGVTIWSASTAGAVRSVPAIGLDGVVYFGAQDSRVYAVNASTGQQLYVLDTTFLTNPIISCHHSDVCLCRWNFTSNGTFLKSGPTIGAANLF